MFQVNLHSIYNEIIFLSSSVISDKEQICNAPSSASEATSANHTFMTINNNKTKKPFKEETNSVWGILSSAWQCASAMQHAILQNLREKNTLLSYTAERRLQITKGFVLYIV